MNLTAPKRRDVIDRKPDEGPAHLSIVEIKLARFRLKCEEFASPVRGLIVGENPGKHTHPDLPLFPWPDTSSAGRLMSMGKLTAGQYLGGLYRRNLCDTVEWRQGRAETNARAIITALFDMPRDLRVVLCGVKVTEAFITAGAAPGRLVSFWHPFRIESRQTAVSIPHPSGLNRLYNDPDTRATAGQVVRWAALGEELPQ